MVRTGAIRPRALRSFATYRGGETLDLVPGAPRALATPGHTAGHMALHLPDRDVLFTGDAIVTRDPLTGRTGPRRVSLGFTEDAVDAARSLDVIASTCAGTLLPGHGDPWTGGAAEAARRAREAGQD
jgi:glyoxylase-like metal-dependent hydrolase (beta-lactamase superfamily II)